VLVEKPFTDNILDARTLVALAQTRSRMLMVSQNYRYWSAPHVAQDIIHSNILGPVASVHVEFATHYSPKYSHFDLKWPILDISIHHFDLMRFVLADNAVEVCCRGWHEPHSRFAGFPAVSMLIRFAKGTTITYIGSLISHIETTWGGQWRIEGSDASMSMRFSAVHNRLDTIAIHRYNTTPEQVALPDMQYTDRTASLIKFAHWIRNGEPTKDVSTALDNLGSLSLMLAAHHSVEHGGEWTPVV
jgi:predicted dehydrogenase